MGLVAQTLAPRLFGLRNLGNTCFLNSVLQCLLRTAPILRTRHTCKGPQFCPGCALRRLASHPGKCTTPVEFLRNIREIGHQFRLGRQEDAHEFLTCLMEKLEPRKSLRHILEGSITSALRCRECGYSSNISDVFWDLSLELTGHTLSRCLRGFCSEELLDADHFLCPQCAHLATCTKQLTISKAPKVLILHFKRFTNQGKKNRKSVRFPLALSLSVEAAQVKYTLYAVIVHNGQSCLSGHYFSYVLWEDGDWYEVNDAKVRKRETTELSSQAYILFYQQKSEPLSRGKRRRSGESKETLQKKRLVSVGS